ncbi:MAG: tetratricopeptide repeat protein [Polyangiaceae bacterium]|jgi:TPR repeat protein
MTPRTFLGLAFCLGLAVAPLFACHRRSLPPDGQPAPSASVISIGVALGTCDDLDVCVRECDAGSADRCRRLAASYAFGHGVSKDEAEATRLYEHACDMNDAPACVFAGQMHEYAHGVPKDDAAAVDLYGRACRLKWAAGCYNLAIMFELGRGVGQDRAKAADLYRLTCSAGAMQACDKAKELDEPAARDAATQATGASE